MTRLKSTERFSDRVDDYVKFRPSYPTDVLHFLKSRRGLTSSDVVVDVGSGTGISAEMFLKSGNVVYGVEPNDSMRAAAEQGLKDYPRFRSQKGTSEATGLANEMADFIIAAQAFHWFEPVATKREFERISKKDATIALIWNDRRFTGSAFAEGYEKLVVEFGIDYKHVTHKNIDSQRIREFLGRYDFATFRYNQKFDFEGLLGRVCSSSYMPNKGHVRYEEMEAALKKLFDHSNENGNVRIDYDTHVYLNESK